MNAHTLAGEISVALQNRRVKNEQSVISAVDGCYTNGAAHEMTNDMASDAGKIERLEAMCLANCASNTGNQAQFVLLDLLWSYLQKVFSKSDMAKDIWYKVTGIRWPTFSHIRWYSKYDVFEILGKYFPDLLIVVTEVADLGISPENASKLLNLLLDARKVWFLKI